MILIIIIFIILFLIYSVLIIYYRIGWVSCVKSGVQASETNFIKQEQRKTPDAEFWGWGPKFEVDHTKNIKRPVTISVIIPARNEEKNIAACLDAMLKQSYPKELFEIIIADDFSTDATVGIVTDYTSENISLISLADFVHAGSLKAYKKKAIEIAINKANGDLIVTTDADCIAGPLWLETIAGFYSEYKPAFIAAPVSYANEKTFLSIFQSLDFMTLQGITGAAVFTKFHYMCNGANLAYEKKSFYEVNGFEGTEHIASGDDMLLMHKIVAMRPNSVQFLCSKSAIIQTTPMPTLASFINQRIRWASKTSSYTDKKIVAVLGIVYLFNLWFVIAGICGIFYPPIFYWLLSILLGKTLVELFFLYPVSCFFNKTKLLWWFPISQPFHIIYTIIAGWFGTFGNYEWKGRSNKDKND